MTQPTKDQLIAARDDLYRIKPHLKGMGGSIAKGELGVICERHLETILSILDNALNPPDSSELKLTNSGQAPDCFKTNEGYSNAPVAYTDGWNAAIDHLSPRIVWDGFVVVPYQPELGTAVQAIEFAVTIDDHYDRLAFLECWSEGDLSEWDDYKAMIAASKGD